MQLTCNIKDCMLQIQIIGLTTFYKTRMSVMTVQVRYVLKCKYCECFDYNIGLNTIPHTHTHTLHKYLNILGEKCIYIIQKTSEQLYINNDLRQSKILCITSLCTCALVKLFECFEVCINYILVQTLMANVITC